MKSSVRPKLLREVTQVRKYPYSTRFCFISSVLPETTNKDITAYFSKAEKPKVSKQAMFRALNEDKPCRFPLLL